jgi:hypothetical protein
MTPTPLTANTAAENSNKATNARNYLSTSCRVRKTNIWTNVIGFR